MSAAWLSDDQRLGAAGYILDQTLLVDRVLAAPDGWPDAAPPLGAYKTYQVPIADIGDATDLTMPQLVAADVLQLVGGRVAARSSAAQWIELTAADDVVRRLVRLAVRVPDRVRPLPH